jgi:hypothetical protein
MTKEELSATDYSWSEINEVERMSLHERIKRAHSIAERWVIVGECDNKESVRRLVARFGQISWDAYRERTIRDLDSAIKEMTEQWVKNIISSGVTSKRL